MTTPWVTKVQSTGILSVAITDAVKNGLWGPAFTESVTVFNRLMTSNKVGVQLNVSSTPPDPEGLGGADILVEVASGVVKYKSIGKEYSVDVGTHGMSGHTQSLSISRGGDAQEMVKAFVFVPTSFDVYVGPVGQLRKRPAGKNPRIFVLVHEFIHCCGLSNREHSDPVLKDIFIRTFDMHGGASPDKDRAYVGGSPGVFAPPFTLSANTANVIKQNWEKQP
jgi:hypothetical protein